MIIWSPGHWPDGGRPRSRTRCRGHRTVAHAGRDHPVGPAHQALETGCPASLKDELAYRSVPYGLLRRSVLTDIGFRYAEGLRTGEDIEATLKLWFRSGPVCYPYGAAAYHQTDDSGAGRVTSSLSNLKDEFTWLERLLASEWLQQATLAERRAVALKILRVHGIGALLRRAGEQMSRMMPSGTRRSARTGWTSPPGYTPLPAAPCRN